MLTDSSSCLRQRFTLAISWLSRFPGWKGDGRSTRRARRRTPSGRTLRLESLEIRDLLSISLPGFAAPDYMLRGAGSGAAPLSTSGPTGYTPSQIRSAYGFDKTLLPGGVAGDGSGTTIAIVDAYDDPKIASDLHQFDLAFGLPDPVLTKENQFGGTAMPRANGGWATEIALDVEWAHAIAPGAKVLLVEASSSSMTNLMTAVNYARRQPGVVAVSMSWGGSEFLGETAYDSYFTTPPGHGGVTFLASSGDSGAPAGYPAISPNVVSVGGTTLRLGSSGNVLDESGWSGSGGGISTVESQPDYQRSVVTQSTTFRANPDVAYDADPNTGFPVYDSYNNPASAPWEQVGGTSDAAPQWAGLIAIADQGRILAGKGALDGRTQTLPMLYSLAKTGFRDVTAGSSTGRPAYSAGPGYDLVTGLGSPYANVLIADLVGVSSPAVPPHISLSAPATSQAGALFSVTVSIVDSSGNVAAGYQGTVRFSSTDTAAGLPQDYTFTTGSGTGFDNGVHTFAVMLKTAGSQTITVADAANGSIVGSTSVVVSPAPAAQIVFGQQPSSAAVGAVISPPVTVKLLDAFGNLVTTDAADQVTLGLGANPAGALLGGTTSVTVSGGVATFKNLSVSKPGSGYTLVASSGGLSAVTSAPFDVSQVAAGTVIEGFESGSSYYVVGARYPTAAISPSAAHDGAYGLVDYGGNDWVYRNDPAAQVRAGDTLSVWLRFVGTANGRAYFGFGAGPGGTLSLVAAPNTNQLLLQDNRGWGFAELAAVTQRWLPNHWYRLEVDWGAGGTIVGKLFDSNGTTLLQQVTASTTVVTAGGIAFRATGSTKYWDTVQRTPGVNPSALAAAAAWAGVPAAPVTPAAPPESAGPARESEQLLDLLFGLWGC
jgi:hypothetical protein